MTTLFLVIKIYNTAEENISLVQGDGIEFNKSYTFLTLETDHQHTQQIGLSILHSL